ncbi:MAG: ATP-binding cassette domain-containing protein [Candidatus Firestonebacteria bacterium]
MINIKNLSLKQGNFELKSLSADIKNEYCVVIGPPGAGKTTLLELLCGLRKADSGTVVLNGEDITFLEPGKRGIGYMPQDYALFPHLSVRKNISFGLDLQRRGAGDIEKKVKELSLLLEIENLLERAPKTLSGGEAQRVAMARALAIAPKLLLLDEPICALDEKTRAKLLRILKTIQKQTGIPFLHVCHFYDEMEALGEKVLILWNGELVQQGGLKEIRKNPAGAQVREFLRKGEIAC